MPVVQGTRPSGAFKAVPGTMAKLKTAILFSVGEKYLIFVIQFVSSIAIARLLSPHEIGIFSIGSLVLSFSHALRDLGISNYLIQERELTPERLRTAGTITLTMSWFLACVAWLASEPLAAFYREDGVGEVLNVLALNFLILPLGSVSGALLRRNMQFDKLIRINLAASLTQSLLGIALCYHGVGFIGLAWAAVAATAVTVALTLLIGGRAASLRPTLGEWRHVMSTGGRFSASAMLNELGLAAPEIIVGKAVSIESAGLLSRAQGVVGLAYRSLMEGLLPVLMPFFSQSHRAGEDLAPHFTKSVRYLTAISFPLFACLAVAMDSIVRLLYGSQWDAAVEPARILCLGMALLSVGHTAGAVIAGMGHARYALRFNLVGQPIKVVLVLLGSFMSLTHVAWGLAIGEVVITTYTLAVLGHILGMRLGQIALAVAPSLYVTLLAVAGCAAFRLAFTGGSLLVEVLGSVSAAALGWGLGLLLFRHPLGGEVAGLVRRVARRA